MRYITPEEEDNMDAESLAKKMIEESDLPKEFPYKTIEEIHDAVKNKLLNIRAHYNYEKLKEYGNKAEIKSHNFWMFVPFIIALTLIILSLYLSNYYLLFGILFSIAGFFLSSPYIKSRELLYVVSFGLFVYFIYKSNLVGYTLSGSFLFSLWATMTARGIFEQAMIRVAMTSTIAFNFFLRSETIIVYDKQADKFY
jgi:hypothetical protein